MFKRPKFLVILTGIYLLYSLINLFMLFYWANAASTHDFFSGDVTNFINGYVMAIWSIIYLGITGYMFYMLLSLSPIGWIMQLGLSAIYVITTIMYLKNPSDIVLHYLVGNTNTAISIIWAVFNCYIIYYFLDPEIQHIFVYNNARNELRRRELKSLIDFANKLVSESQSGKFDDLTAKKIKLSALPELQKPKYISGAKILIQSQQSIKHEAELQELNMIIKNKARKILNLLESMLPALRDYEVLDENSYEYNKKHGWNIEDIIYHFQNIAVENCSDKSDFSDKILNFSKKVDEIELLNETNRLMGDWLENCGSELGNLIHIHDSSITA